MGWCKCATIEAKWSGNHSMSFEENPRDEGKELESASGRDRQSR